MEERKSKKQRIYLGIGIVLFLILVLSASYAYFAITSVNNATATTVTGTGEELGSPTLTTNTSNLKLNLTADFMSKSYSYDRIYATPSGAGIVEESPYELNSTISLNNGRYKLATVSVTGGNLSYNCTYNFDVSATVSKTISDNSGQDIHVIVTSPKGETYRYRLDQLLAGTKTISGTISDLTPGENQEFIIESYAYNDAMYSQNDLSDNTYTITVTPKSGTNGFSCTAATTPKTEGFAKNLIDSNKMIQTGFEGDGYRFIGTGKDDYCVYDGGKLYKRQSGDTCPNLYNISFVQNGVSIEYKYDSACWGGENETCTAVTGTIGKKLADNYVCFGTTNKSDCTSNPDKYMYRIIGVFPDEEGNQHVKLIKKNTIGRYTWNASATSDVQWHDSELYKGLNGSYFYTNTNYDYMQNTTWRSKITNWKWTEATERVYLRGNITTGDLVAPMKYSAGNLSSFQKETYLHEMNRRGKKYNFGEWTNISARIGLMYVSDYYLTLPAIEENVVSFEEALRISWIAPANSFTTLYPTWTMTRSIVSNTLKSIALNPNGNISEAVPTATFEVQPVFYLNSDIELSSGTGTETDPYILK